jgi:hypothetical protein
VQTISSYLLKLIPKPQNYEVEVVEVENEKTYIRKNNS